MRRDDRKCGGCGYEPARDRRGEVIDLHDCDQVAAIAELVPIAETLAGQEVPIPKRRGEVDDVPAAKWNRAFHTTMDELARDAGLRRTIAKKRMNGVN